MTSKIRLLYSSRQDESDGDDYAVDNATNLIFFCYDYDDDDDDDKTENCSHTVNDVVIMTKTTTHLLMSMMITTTTTLQLMMSMMITTTTTHLMTTT